MSQKSGEDDPLPEDGQEKKQDPMWRRPNWRRIVVVPFRQVILTEHPALQKFFGGRCTHLAGMIAYFGILSIIPGVFLILSTLALTDQFSSESYILVQLKDIMPDYAANQIVHIANTLRLHQNSIGMIGLIGLVWGATNFFSCIESALNLIYEVENRWFFQQKAWVLLLMITAVGLLGLTTLGATFAVPILQDAGKQFNVRFSRIDAFLSIVVSFVGAFVFLLMSYRLLCNREMHVRHVWRGAIIGATLFQVSIHVLPAYLTGSSDSFVVKAFAGALIVLIWFYLTSLFLLIGAVFNWWWEIIYLPARKMRRIARSARR